MGQSTYGLRRTATKSTASGQARPDEGDSFSFPNCLRDLSQTLQWLIAFEFPRLVHGKLNISGKFLPLCAEYILLGTGTRQV